MNNDSFKCYYCDEKNEDFFTHVSHEHTCFLRPMNDDVSQFDKEFPFPNDIEPCLKIDDNDLNTRISYDNDHVINESQTMVFRCKCCDYFTNVISKMILHQEIFHGIDENDSLSFLYRKEVNFRFQIENIEDLKSKEEKINNQTEPMDLVLEEEQINPNDLDLFFLLT